MKLENLRQFLLRNKWKAEALLFMLSLLALSLFVSNEIVAARPDLLPLSQESWTSVQLWARFAVWASFVAHFLSYGFLSGNPIRYAKEHLVELLICLAWFPHESSLLREFSSLLSLETVQMVGTMANGFVVVRHIVRNLSTHPVIVTGSVFLFVIVTASQLLVQVEPQTFPSLFDAIWYSVVTTTTIGYGDIVPKTFVGRSIGMVLMLAGISLAAAFIGIVSQFMQRRIGQSQDNREIARLKSELEEERSAKERILLALERDNELKQELLELLQKTRKSEAETEPAESGKTEKE